MVKDLHEVLSCLQKSVSLLSDTTQTTTELQQNGIPEEVEPTTTPQPPTTGSQEYVYEPTVDYMTKLFGHTEGALETEQFTTLTEPEAKSEWGERGGGGEREGGREGERVLRVGACTYM